MWISTLKWRTDPLWAGHATYLPSPSTISDINHNIPQIILRGVGQRHFLVCSQRPADSPTPRWNISRYLLTTTRGLTKNSKNFQPFLRQVRHHIVCDLLEYWHLTQEFSSGNIMLLTWEIMPHSKPNSSLSFALITEIENHRVRVVTKCGEVQWLISPTTLNLCSAMNLTFDYFKDISFTFSLLTGHFAWWVIFFQDKF